MTSMCDNLYEITRYFPDFENQLILNSNDARNDPEKFINSIKDKYNNFTEDTKKLLAYTVKLFTINKSLEEEILSLKDKIYNFQREYLKMCKLYADSCDIRFKTIGNNVSEDNMCCICMTNPRKCVYVECGHFCACVGCCETMGDKCPICRQEGKFIKVINV